MGLCIFVSIFTGCSSETANILNGTFSYHKKQYRHAVSEFMSANETAMEENNQIIIDYSLYDLGTAYAKLEEYEAALPKIELNKKNFDNKKSRFLSGRRDHEADLILIYSIRTNMYMLHVNLLFVISLENIKK